MKTLLVVGFLALMGTEAFASVVKSQDTKNNCTLYRAIHADSKKQMQKNETVFLNREVYGIAFENMDVDFDNREVRVDVVMTIVLGLNKNITEQKAIISSDNPKFSSLVNQLNKKLSMLESVCINNQNEVIYAKTFDR